MTRPVRSQMSGSCPSARSRSQAPAVRRSCQTIALQIGWPVLRSQTTVVSRWLVMPIAAMSVAVRLALRSASDATLDCEAQISLASCSTQPGRGNIWRNSCCATATIAPWWSKTMARELVVPWSSARICFIGGSSLPAKLEKLRADHTTDDGPDNRHPGVAPVARALAGDGQKRVDEPRSEIPRRIDCVAGGTAERESDRE